MNVHMTLFSSAKILVTRVYFADLILNLYFVSSGCPSLLKLYLLLYSM